MKIVQLKAKLKNEEFIRIDLPRPVEIKDTDGHSECVVQVVKAWEEDNRALSILKRTGINIKELQFRLKYEPDDDIYLYYKYDRVMTRGEFNLISRILITEDYDSSKT